MTPSEAGFDGTFSMGRPFGSSCKIILRHGAEDGPHRYSGIRKNEFVVWKRPDGTVSKMLYRNHDGKLFELPFVPMGEP